MFEIELPRSKKPSQPPAVMRLEDRVMPSMVQYGAGYQFTDGGGTHSVGVAFQWDANSMQGQAAVANVNYAINNTLANLATAINALDASHNADGTYGDMQAQAALNQDASGGLDAFNGVTSIATSSTLAYKINTSGVTIASSVVDVPTAKARAAVLVADAKYTIQCQQTLCSYIQSLTGTDYVAALVYYSGTISSNSNRLQQDMAELQLLKQSQWNTGANANAIFK